ncbi:MAG: thioredoxin domain-containing protein [Deltaproteobacteria bacterium]|nr:thioredoxin domain-containing protein [Deltaproteobacteria bacterium]
MSKGAASISIILAAIFGFFIGVVAGGKWTGGEGTPATEAAATGANQEDSTRIPVGNSPVNGPNSALVTIIEFSDFECPFCSRVEDTMRQIHERYGNKVRVVWKNAPLPFHQNAEPAARASVAAHRQGKFWQMHRLMFQNQRELTQPNFERWATEIGCNLERFRADMNSPQTAQEVAADKALAERLSAQGTPNFFINGTNLVGAQPLERFTAVIDQVLARAETLQPRNRVYAQMVDSPVAAPEEPQRPRQPEQPRQELDPNTVYNVPVGTSPVLGAMDALVTVVVFSDFECPFCARVEPALATLRERYGRDIRFVWKHMPLPFHQKAGPASEATQEAFAQQSHAGFWRFHDRLFVENRPADILERPSLERIAQELGLNMARFRAALDNHTHNATIEADKTLATAIAANGTPHFFINGHRLVGAQPVDRFAAVVDTALAEARAKVASGTPRARVYQELTSSGANAPVYQNNPTPAPGAAAQPEAPNPNRVYTIRPGTRSPFRGGATARVVIEHFSDYQCPFCTRVNPALEEIARTYGDRVKIVWRDYPLPFHSGAMPAAMAAREAHAQQGNAGYWRFHDALFTGQSELGGEGARAFLERTAQAQGLNMERFRAALDNNTHQQAIRDDMAALDASGAEAGTPASFINGRFISGAQPFAEFQRVIDQVLAAR